MTLPINADSSLSTLAFSIAFVLLCRAIKDWAPLGWTPDRLKHLAGHREIAVRVAGAGDSAGGDTSATSASTSSGVYGDPGTRVIYSEHKVLLNEFIDTAVQHPDGDCPLYAARLLLNTLPELLEETPAESPIRACLGMCCLRCGPLVPCRAVNYKGTCFIFGSCNRRPRFCVGVLVNA